jgi:lipopolysaccharide export system permease protein
MKPRVAIIDRYITREMFSPFLVGIFGFILIMVTDILFTLTDMIINKGVPFFAVMKLLVFKLPAIMVLTFPVSTLFGVAMAMGRLSYDSEIIALRTSGISMFRIATPIVVISLFISLMSYMTNEFVVPWANHVSDGIIRQIILKKPVTQVKENVFFKDKGNRYFYVRRADPKRGTLEDVMMYELEGGPVPRVVVAKSAEFKGDVWDLKAGVIHKYSAEGHLEYDAKFDSMRIIVSEDFLGGLGYSRQKTSQEMNSRDLHKLISMLKRGGVNTRALLVDFYMKFSVPLTCFVFALIGVPLSMPGIRTGRAFGVIMCIVVVFSFYVFASVSRSFGYGGMAHPLLAAFVPQATFAILGIALLVREAAFR